MRPRHGLRRRPRFGSHTLGSETLQFREWDENAFPVAGGFDVAAADVADEGMFRDAEERGALLNGVRKPLW